MIDRSHRAFPQFLRFLSSHPAASAVAEALARGPLASLQVNSLIIWERRGELAHAIGTFAARDDVTSRFAKVPLSVALPLCEAIVHQRVVLHRWSELVHAYPLLDLDGDIWARRRAEAPLGGLLSAPIVVNGESAGSWGAQLLEFPHDRPAFESIVDGVSSALALWLAHPQTTTVPVPDTAAAHEPVALTRRQQQLLALVLHGCTNAQIAERLHTSRSTVKQDLQRATRSLRATDRTIAAERARSLGLLSDDVFAQVVA